MPKRAKCLCLLGWASILALVGNPVICAAAAEGPAAPKLDKPKLETYLRYIEGYTAGVKLAIDDPTPSAYQGISRVIVHISMGAQKLGDRLYYVTGNGDRFISGTVWDFNENPFLDTLERLPTDGPSFGPANAKVTVVVFSDFECPYCREFAKTVRDNIPETYPADVRVIFEDFPIDAIHPWARAASEAARCLADQSAAAFWAFHDWDFEHQGEVDGWFKHPETAKNLRDQTLAIAKQQNLDAAKVASCIDTHATAKEVEESLRRGRALQIQQTPTLFINGRMIPGAVAWKTLDAVIQLELNRPKEIGAPPAAKCCEVTVPTIFKK